jgi:hypothetical protein
MSYRGKKVKFARKATTATSAPAATPRVRRTRRVSKAPANSPAGGSLGRTILSGGGGLLGGLLGGAFGAPTVGRSIGSMIGDGAATILGMGAYDIKENTLLSTSPTVPVMHAVSNSIRISHREYIGDVVTASTANTFKNIVYPLNPGMSETFPWLSSIAQAFEQYELMGFVIEFKSGSGDALNSVNTALGEVLMAAKYDASEPAYTSKQSMLNSQWATQGKPSVNVFMPIECSKDENPFSVMYVRNAELEANKDIKMYDICNINVATDGMQGTNVNVGSLWITYDILLKKPISLVSGGFTLKDAIFSTSSTTTGITDSEPFGNVLSSSGTYGKDNIGITVSSDTITFPANIEGMYEIQYFTEGTAHLITHPTLAFTNCSLVTSAPGGGISIINNDDTTYPLTKSLSSFVVNIPLSGSSATVKFNHDGLYPTTPVLAQLTISQVNPLVYS